MPDPPPQPGTLADARLRVRIGIYWLRSRCRPSEALACSLKRCSLSFQDDALEEAFMQADATRLFPAMKLLFVLLPVGMLMYLAHKMMLFFSDHDTVFGEHNWILLLEAAIGLAIVFALGVFLFILSHFWQRLRPIFHSRVTVRMLELILGIFAQVGLLGFAIACDDCVLARVLQLPVEPEQCDCAPLTIALLGASAMVNTSIPLRFCWCVSYTGTVTLIYLLAHAIVWRPASHTALLQISWFLGVLIIQLFGKRESEQKNREAFLDLSRERRLRMERERDFSASEATSEMSDRGALERDALGQLRVAAGTEDAGSLVSRPSTAVSRAFQCGARAPEDLQRLLALGMEEQWLLPSSSLRLLPDSLLGSGGFGLVVQGDYNFSEVAVKAPRHGALDRGADFEQLCNELRLLRRLRHPNIVTLYGACLDTEHLDLALVLELLRGETLLKYVVKRNPASDVRLQLLDDIAAAIVYLHGRAPPIVHGDLQAANVFVECIQGRLGSCRAKLLDFGLSLSRTKHAVARGGTLHWMAPELLRQPARPPERSADIYTVGCLIYFVVMGTPPHYGVSGQQLRELASSSQPPPGLTWASAPLVASHRSLAESCCNVEPLQRPSIGDVLDSLSVAKRQARGGARGGASAAAPALHEALEESREALKRREAERETRHQGLRTSARSRDAVSRSFELSSQRSSNRSSSRSSTRRSSSKSWSSCLYPSETASLSPHSGFVLASHSEDCEQGWEPEPDHGLVSSI